MERIGLRGLTVGLTLGLVVGLGGGLAHAASSSWKNYSAGSKLYRNQAQIETNKYAFTLSSSRQGNVPQGYLGAMAVIRFGGTSGAVCNASDWTYSSTSATTWNAQIKKKTSCAAGNYISYGTSQGYSGTSYATAATYGSPAVYLS